MIPPFIRQSLEQNMAKKSEPRADADTLILASETLSGDLRDFILDRLKHQHNPLPWNMRPEADQRETITAAELAARPCGQQWRKSQSKMGSKRSLN
jgi:hypothetical protein